MENSILFSISVLLFLFSPLLLLFGLISPKKFSTIIKKDLTRKQITKYLTTLFFVSFVSALIFVPPTEYIPSENNVKISENSNETKVLENGTTSVIDEASDNRVENVVSAVVDGDTIKLTSGQTVRFIGIDTPETVHPSKPVECYGKEASEKTKELLLGKTVLLEKDISETDQFGRLLRYVYVEDTFVNDFLVREGFAVASSYPPDVKYQESFGEAQQEALEKGRGLWGSYCDSWDVTPSPKPTKVPSSTPTVQPVYSPRPTSSPGYAPQPTYQPTTQPVQQTGEYSCNCAKTCTNMASCEEAYYQLNTCGCSQRDGDNDGVPCESICR
jgi:endonuclease YncB( thermonuclease family)